MPKFTIITERKNWTSAAAYLEPVPRPVEVNCREHQPQDTDVSKEMAIEHDSEIDPDIVRLFLSRLKQQWPGLEAKLQRSIFF